MPITLAFLFASVFLFDSTLLAKDEFTEIRFKVVRKIARIERLIEASDKKLIDTRRAKVSAQVASRFIQFANWDHHNKAELAAVIRKWEPVAQSAEMIADQLAVRELNDCIQLLDQAYEDLVANQSNVDNPRAGFEVDLANVIPIGGNYYQGDRPVFPHSILWAPESLPSSFGQFSLGYMHPDYLNETGDPINSGQQAWFSSQLDHIANNGKKAYLFLGHVAPAWARNNENTSGSTTFIDYNIDHPDAKKWWDDLLDGLGPTFFNHPAALKNTMLANEPHWFSTEGRWGHVQISDLTNQHFRTWLLERHNNLETVNTRWNSNYKTIDQISIVTPIDPVEFGGGKYYDWCTFNMHRATTFFHMLDAKVHQIEPTSLNHVKIPSQLLLDSTHDHGIDWRRIANEFSMLGIDSTVTHNAGISRFAETQRQSMYSIDWTPSAAGLDFLKSVAPNKIVFDSEWHAVSNIHWRDPEMKNDYVRSCLWLHHLSGMGINQAWYWGRQSDGAPIAGNQNEFFGSLTTQPIALNAYLRSMIELNDFAPQIVDIVNSDRPVALLYCEDSAIQDPGYLVNFANAYQALRFSGLRINVMPIENLPALNRGQSPNFNALVIPPTKYCTGANLSKLQNGIARSTALLQIGTGNFVLDPYGQHHSNSSRQFLKRSASIKNGSATQLHSDFNSALSDLISAANMVTGENGKPPWGILQYHSTNGMTVLINVLCEPVSLTVNGEAITVAPMETKVLTPE